MNKKTFLLTLGLAVMSTSMFAQKFSTTTLLKMQEHTAAKHAKSAQATAQTVDAFITISNEDAVEAMKSLGVEVNGRYSDDLVTATLPINALEAVAKIDGVVYIQAGNEANLLLDVARKEAGADKCHVATATEKGAFKGKGVVVGIVDNGFDFAHVDFKDAEGNTRIKRIWVQSSNAGNTPKNYNYGTEYSTIEEYNGARYDMAGTFHGSHVAGIAAGSDYASNYYGVAPEADLVLVSFKNDNSKILDGIKYVFDYAKEVGKPAVVNISLGSHVGPHDGTSAFDKGIASIVGPGRIVVGAAGNEGTDNLHCSKTLTATDKQLKTFVGFPSKTKQAYCSIWGDKDKKMSVRVAIVDALKGKILAKTDAVATDGVNTLTQVLPDGSGIVGQVEMTMSIDAGNQRPNTLLKLRVSQVGENRLAAIVIEGEDGETINMWNCVTGGYFTSANKRGWTDGDNKCTVGELGGESPDIITVGSYNTKTQYSTISGDIYGVDESLVGTLGAHSLFSSIGPTADGRQKPDVSAPGCALISATSRYYQGFSAQNCAYKSGDCYYDVNIGTSMASPFVAGSVALWLEANPQLTPDMVRDILANTGRYDGYTDRPSKCDKNTWGYGKLDVYAGLKQAILSTGINDTAITEGEAFSINYNRAQRTATVSFNGNNAQLSVYAIDGTQVLNTTVQASGENIDLASLAAGVYVFKLNNGNKVQSVKVAL